MVASKVQYIELVATKKPTIAQNRLGEFILLEQYAEDRKADTWTEALTEARQELPTKSYNPPVMKGGACSITSKKTWVSTTRQTCFTSNMNWSRARVAPWPARCVREATQTVEKAPTPAAKQALERAMQQQQRAQQSIWEISTTYHPKNVGLLRSKKQNRAKSHPSGVILPYW